MLCLDCDGYVVVSCFNSLEVACCFPEGVCFAEEYVLCFAVICVLGGLVIVRHIEIQDLDGPKSSYGAGEVALTAYCDAVVAFDLSGEVTIICYIVITFGQRNAVYCYRSNALSLICAVVFGSCAKAESYARILDIKRSNAEGLGYRAGEVACTCYGNSVVICVFNCKIAILGYGVCYAAEACESYRGNCLILYATVIGESIAEGYFCAFDALRKNMERCGFCTLEVVCTLYGKSIGNYFAVFVNYVGCCVA